MDMDMDMDGIFHLHGKPVINSCGHSYSYDNYVTHVNSFKSPRK